MSEAKDPDIDIKDWSPVRWELSDQDFKDWFICAVNGRNGRRYVVRNGAYFLDQNAMLEYEPLPSSRDDAFLKRTRLNTFDEAVARFTAFKERQANEKELYVD